MADPVEKSVNPSWQQKLQDLSDKLFGPSEDIWITNEYKKIQDATVPHPRLLKENEKIGIVELPIIIGKGYVSNLAWKLLERDGWKLEWAMSNYTLVHNARILGISDEMLQESTSSFSTALTSLKELDPSLKHLGSVGPIRGKGKHLYVPLFPSALVADNEISITDWDFLGLGSASVRISREVRSASTGHLIL